MATVEQTLHGYQEGHRLLAASRTLEPRESTLLERLGDLSGYLPRDTSFTQYHTAFPCGRYYAFACTWPDVTATRAGTVLTHTLLVTREHAGTIEDPWVLAPFHRRPASALERSAYEKPLSFDVLPPAPEMAPLPATRSEAAVALLLATGPDDRPLLWVNEEPPTSVVRFLWSLLAPGQRERFAFCTFALQPRSVEGRSFDFLGLPPAARGSFLDRAGSEAWWDTERGVLAPRLQAIAREPWVQEIAREGPAALERRREWCRKHQLDFPVSQIGILSRLMELEQAASERLSAARSWADLLERLWPDLPPRHPCADRALRQILVRLPEAPVEKRPLFELTDFLQRPLTRRRLVEDESFDLEVELLCARELRARLARAVESTIQDLLGLVEARGPRWKEQSLRIIQDTVAATPNASAHLSPALLSAAARANNPPLAEVVLAPLTPTDRLRALALALESQGELHDQIRGLVKEVAARLLDAELAFEAGYRRDGPLPVLIGISVWLTERDPGSAPRTISRLLPRLDANEQLTWALSVPAASFADLAAETGARAARELHLSVEEVALRCDGVQGPNGVRTFLAFAADLERREELSDVLRKLPRLGSRILGHLLREPWNLQIEEFTGLALRALPPGALLSPELRQAFLAARDHDRWRSREAVEPIGRQWLRAVSEQSAPVEELASWLDVKPLRSWLRDATVRLILSSTSTTSGGQLFPSLIETMESWRRKGARPYELAWMAPLLTRLLQNITPAALDDATPFLAPLIRSMIETHEGLGLAGDVLTAVARFRPPRGWQLIELGFSRLYTDASQEKPSLWKFVTSFLFGSKGRDRASVFREWLVDTYASMQWPADSFLRCLDGDTSSFYRLVEHARRTGRAASFLRQLPAALETDPSLASRWERPIHDALRDLSY